MKKPGRDKSLKAKQSARSAPPRNKVSVGAGRAKPTIIDLFAGAGGISLGFEQVGFRTVAAVENDPTCVECLRKNFPGMKVLDRDVQKISASEILETAGLRIGEVDVVAGGPPCQGFSLIGLRDPHDPRCGLVFEFHRLVAAIQPKYFVMENVPGIMSADSGRFIRELIKLLESDGYNITHPVRILNSAHYGVPQDRRRVFILGTRSDVKARLCYPLPTHYFPSLNGSGGYPQAELNLLERTPTVREAIEDLPDVDKYHHLVEGHEVPYEKRPSSEYARIMRGVTGDKGSILKPPRDWKSEICTGCRRTVHGPVLKKRFKSTAQGDSVPVSRLHMLRWEGIANTLRAGTPRERGAHSSPRPIHPIHLRVVTVREGARLQSFPDWHQFHHTKWHGFRQVGNAVPPLLARAVANQVLGCLRA